MNLFTNEGQPGMCRDAARRVNQDFPAGGLRPIIALAVAAKLLVVKMISPRYFDRYFLRRACKIERPFTIVERMILAHKAMPGHLEDCVTQHIFYALLRRVSNYFAFYGHTIPVSALPILRQPLWL